MIRHGEEVPLRDAEIFGEGTVPTGTIVIVFRGLSIVS
jgi:hypothetical protein